MSNDQYFPLPRVESSDIERILPTEITDPRHRGRWRQLVRTNPELARGILRYAMDSARDSGDKDSVHQAISLATFALQAVASALERERSNAGAVDEYRQL